MDGHWSVSYLSLIIFSVLLVIIAASLTVYVAPTAAGSGVAEAMGYLNGVAYPKFITLKALGVKFLGLALSVSAGICGGKEIGRAHV